MSLSGDFVQGALRLLRRQSDRAMRATQRQAELAAQRLGIVETPLAQLAGASLRLTALSHRCADRLLQQGLISAQGALADGVGRLRTAAQAESWSTLYRGQLNATSASRQRLAAEAASAWDIVATSAREFATLARETTSQLRDGKSTPRRGRPVRRRSRSGVAGL